jgi:hypothetical protein
MTQSLTATKEARARMRQEFTMRMLGQNVTFTGWQWLELLDELREDSEHAARIRRLLAE